MSSSYKFPDDADASDLGTTFENHCTVLSGTTDAGPRHSGYKKQVSSQDEKDILHLEPLSS